MAASQAHRDYMRAEAIRDRWVNPRDGATGRERESGTWRSVHVGRTHG